MAVLRRILHLVMPMAFLLMAGGPVFAQPASKHDAMLQDTLPAAVKTDVRRFPDQLPGTFTTDLKALKGRVLSPVGENDPIKYAMTLPGVSSGAEGFSAFFARGGNLGNNLFALDGVRIYGLSHLLGLTTSVPGDAIETMDRRFPDIDGGRPFPARYDRRHILHANAQWKGISAGFTLQSGHWETVAAGQYIGYLPGSEVVLDYFSHPNNWQLPLYVRLDLGYQFEFTTGKSSAHPLQHILNLGIFNVLNRHNPSMLSYDTETKTWNQVSLFPIMPSIKYTVEL